MNAHESSMDDHETLPVPAESREVVASDPVLDGELVEEPPQPRYFTPWLGRVASWWLRSPRVPVWLKSRRQAVQALKDLLGALLRSPDRFVGAVVRGMVVGARWWRRWMTVRDYRDAAEQSEKLADKFTEIRARTLFRWKVTGAVAVSTAVGVAAFEGAVFAAAEQPRRAVQAVYVHDLAVVVGADDDRVAEERAAERTPGAPDPEVRLVYLLQRVVHAAGVHLRPGRPPW